jgi:hypothetical protein
MEKAPVNFRELFSGMGDIYNGIYQPLLTEYQVNEQIGAEELLRRTLTYLPVDQVPSVFIYQDPNTTLRIIHHLHRVQSPLGLPATQLTDAYLGFSGEIYNGTVQVVQIPAATFFAPTGDIVVPTSEALTAQLAAAVDDMVGPYNPGDPDTVVINTRRAVPIPYAYVGLVAFRTWTPQEAWQQLGQQIIMDGREQDCEVLINFLRAANVVSQPNGPPSTVQANALAPPLDGPIMEHTHHKLRQLVPGVYFQPAQGGALLPAHVIALEMQMIAEGFKALRADLLRSREAAAAPKSFTEVFPAHAPGMRRLCMAGNDDQLPEFWRFFAIFDGKSGPAVSALNSLVNTRSNMEDSARVLPIISPAMFVKIRFFHLGSVDLDVITEGVSPFLMCPLYSTNANATMLLMHHYMMLLDHSNQMSLSDIKQLVLSDNYNIPVDFYALVDYIGAYSVLWDVLVGQHHPLAIALRQHHLFWTRKLREVINAAPEVKLRNALIVGTLRYIQLAVLRYVNKIMYQTDGIVPVPTFNHIEEAINYRLFQNFPGLPSSYSQPASATITTSSTHRRVRQN